MPRGAFVKARPNRCSASLRASAWEMMPAAELSTEMWSSLQMRSRSTRSKPMKPIRRPSSASGTASTDWAPCGLRMSISFRHAGVWSATRGM